MQPNFIYLASQSPRRAQLLSQLSVTFEVLVADASEDAEALEAVHGKETPARYVQRVTQLKLAASVERMQRRGLATAPVLCADTTVTLGPTILGKPESTVDAVRMLHMLSGATHRVLTAVAISHKGKTHATLSESRVTFAPMTRAQIQAYAATGEPLGKAGAYAVQGRAAMHIARISGSYSGIMGLPLHETALLLQAAGLKF